MGFSLWFSYLPESYSLPCSIPWWYSKKHTNTSLIKHDNDDSFHRFYEYLVSGSSSEGFFLKLIENIKKIPIRNKIARFDVRCSETGNRTDVGQGHYSTTTIFNLLQVFCGNFDTLRNPESQIFTDRHYQLLFYRKIADD